MSHLVLDVTAMTWPVAYANTSFLLMSLWLSVAWLPLAGRPDVGSSGTQLHPTPSFGILSPWGGGGRSFRKLAASDSSAQSGPCSPPRLPRQACGHAVSTLLMGRPGGEGLWTNSTGSLRWLQLTLNSDVWRTGGGARRWEA